MTKTYIHYALQTCDVKSREAKIRFCSDSRTEISKKCVRSFLLSVQHCLATNIDTIHHVAIIDDHSTEELQLFLEGCVSEFSTQNLVVELIHMEKTGIIESIRQCYLWLQDNGKDLVYQVQDDYLFVKTAVTDMVDIYTQMLLETGEQTILSPWNQAWVWQALYRNKVTPRTVIVGKAGYWIQYYDMSCSFLTSHKQFSQHWDLYDMFFFLITRLDKTNNELENKSLNYMLTQRNILGLTPVNSLAFHMQSDLDKDPHIDWKPIWDSVDIHGTSGTV